MELHENLLEQRRKDFFKKKIINENVGIRRNQDHLVDTFKTFYNKSGLRISFRGHITGNAIDLLFVSERSTGNEII